MHIVEEELSSWSHLSFRFLSHWRYQAESKRVRRELRRHVVIKLVPD